MTTERNDQQSGQNQDSNRSQQTGGQPTDQQQTGGQPTDQQQNLQTGSDSQGSGSDSQSGGEASTGQAQDSDTITEQTTPPTTGEDSSDPTTGGAFVGSQGKDNSEYLQEKDKSDSDIEGTSGKSQLDGQ